MIGGILSLHGLKRALFIHKNILWDIEPKQLMGQRRVIDKDEGKVKKPIHGYIFYLDKMAGKMPKLYLMCHTATGYAETVAKIDEVPDELIAGAVEENKDKEFFGMYPINKKIENWLKKELGITKVLKN